VEDAKSWYLVATEQDDPAHRAAPPRIQARGLDGGRGQGSHAVYVSQPRSVAHLIDQAAKSLTLAAR
jgi:hypothetical protein